MAAGTALRFATVAVLALLLGGVLAALRLRRGRGAGEARLGLWQHLEELRRRILAVAGTLLGGTVLALTVRVGAWRGWPVPVPALYDTVAAQLFRAMAAHLVPPGVRLVVTSPVDGFQAQFEVALAFGVALTVPVALYQLGRFFGPALRAHERRLLALALLPATALFLLGAAFGYAIVLPVTLAALYQFPGTLGAESLLQVGELSSFVLGFVLAFGAAFQAPLVMVVLSRVGLVRPRTYWRFWRHATLAIVIAAGILTP
ncbi:MAG: sec-independent protein translocase protein TatC, partial [Thermoplasmata archaeon]|nr:sec-independent protein translocase protein TatC [Thermoplasmata archaeon]